MLSSALFRSDALAGFFRGVAIVAGIVLVLINWGHIVDEYAAEFHAVILLMIAGVSLSASANDLITLFLSLELVSIPTYVFLYLPRRDPGGPEATTKYFLLSVFSSAIVLYGFQLFVRGRGEHAPEHDPRGAGACAGRSSAGDSGDLGGLRGGGVELSRDRGSVPFLRAGRFSRLARGGLCSLVLYPQDRRVCRADLDPLLGANGPIRAFEPRRCGSGSP